MTRRAKPVIVFNVRILKSDGKTKVKCSFTAFEKDATKPIKVGQRLTVVGEFTLNLDTGDEGGLSFWLPLTTP